MEAKADEDWTFVKWTRNGEDYSSDARRRIAAGNRQGSEKEKAMSISFIGAGKRLAAPVFLLLTAVLLAGCGVRLNINKKPRDVEDMIAENALAADPADYNPDGSCTITFRYDKGGFRKMDLSRAYVADHPVTVQDRIDLITGDDIEEFPPLPADAQDALDEATGADQLRRIAVVMVVTVDDNTLKVTFTDTDAPAGGREYYFIIPNEGLAGSAIPG